MPKRLPVRVSIIFMLFLLCACGGESVPQAVDPELPVADLVFTNGVVYTVDPQRSVAQAVAVGDGKILAVGSNEQVAAYIGAETEVVELAGHMLLPGFQDAHNHAASSGFLLGRCTLHGISEMHKVLAAIADCIERQPGDGWVLGEGWILTIFPPDGIPDRKVLDTLISDRPAAFWSYDAHSVWVNTRALEVMGIDASTPDPEGGRIDRDPASGELLGGLHENAMDIVRAFLPPVTDEELVEGVRLAQSKLNSLGITAVQDPLAETTGGKEYRVLPAYRIMADRGELTMRVRAAMYWEPKENIAEQVTRLNDLRRRFSGGLLQAGGIKLYQDGVIETGLAAMLEPYIGLGEGYRGPVLHEPAELAAIATAADAAGFQMHIHAIGDRAIRDSLDAIQAAREANGVRDSRHQIAHLELIDPQDIPRFAKLDVIAVFQPQWAYRDTYVVDMTIPKIGEQRARWLYPVGSVLHSGGRIAFGSDWSVDTADPLEIMETAVTRIESLGNEGEPLFAEEGISVEEAIAAYTIHAAFANFLDESTGSIEVGKLADLVVLERNLLTIPAFEISDAKVLATYLEGRPVYRASN